MLMTIKVTNIEYDLFDEETNPNDDITPADFELPSKLTIEQKDINKFYGEDFDVDTDLPDLISCFTGFFTQGFKYEVIS